MKKKISKWNMAGSIILSLGILAYFRPIPDTIYDQRVRGLAIMICGFGSGVLFLIDFLQERKKKKLKVSKTS